MKKELIVPTVNLNGNNGTSLVGMSLDIKHALEKASKTIADGMDLGHGRNFQTLGSEHSTIAADARAALIERIQLLNGMADEFEQLALNIHRQVQK
jgi:hypothetical protein